MTFFYLEEAGSTNDYVKAHIEALPRLAAVYTGHQTMGRGRLGRRFESGKGQIAAMSFLFKEVAVQDMAFFSLLAGLAAARAIERLCGCDCRIKWPNDIILHGKKVCGILCEGVSGAVVVGIGVNLTQDEDFFTRNNLPNAVSLLLSCGQAPGLEKTVKAVSAELTTLWERYFNGEKTILLEEYKSRCLTLGQDIKTHGTPSLQGRAVDIAPDGALIVNSGGVLHTVHSGEVSVRLTNGEYI